MNTTGLLPRRLATRLALAALLGVLPVLFGAGCGQSGPLFLPTEEPAARVDPGAAATDGRAAGQSSETAADEDEDQGGNGEKTP
jgi:predicted small lipoprotein YifL